MSLHFISDLRFARRVAFSVGSFLSPVFYCLLAHSFVWPLASGFSLRRVFPLYCFGLLPLSLENRILKVSFGDCSAGTAGGWWVGRLLGGLALVGGLGVVGAPLAGVPCRVLLRALLFVPSRSPPLRRLWSGRSLLGRKFPWVTGSFFWNFSARRF